MSKVFCDSANYARLRLLHLLYDIEIMWQNTMKHSFSMFYTPIKHGFLTNQSMCRDLSVIESAHETHLINLTSNSIK